MSSVASTTPRFPQALSRRRILIGLGGAAAVHMLPARSAWAEGTTLAWERVGDLP